MLAHWRCLRNRAVQIDINLLTYLLLNGAILLITGCVWLASDARRKHTGWTEAVHRDTRLPSTDSSRLLADGTSAAVFNHSDDHEDRRGWQGSHYVT